MLMGFLIGFRFCCYVHGFVEVFVHLLCFPCYAHGLCLFCCVFAVMFMGFLMCFYTLFVFDAMLNGFLSYCVFAGMIMGFLMCLYTFFVFMAMFTVFLILLCFC